MKSLIAALLAAVSINGSPAHADARWLVPSPLSVLLTLGAWTKKDKVEVFYVQVQGHGSDERSAREEGFRLAVNQAVGSLLLSHRHVENQEVIRNEIINYSSGHVHDFQILDRQSGNNGHTIVMDVWVRRSLIADRLLSESRAAGEIEGGKISAQITSLEQRRLSTEQVLESVLRDFPQRSFDISVGNTRVVVNNDRTYWLTVPVQIQWAKTYLTSMAEALKTVNPNPQCARWFGPRCDHMTRIASAGTAAHFDDQGIYWLFSRHLRESQPVLQIGVLDIWGKVRFQGCYHVAEITQHQYAPWYFVDVGGNQATLYEGRSKTYQVQINIGNLPVQNLDRAEARVVRLSQCRQLP
jgi:hypothetical protein